MLFCAIYMIYLIATFWRWNENIQIYFSYHPLQNKWCVKINCLSLHLEKSGRIIAVMQIINYNQDNQDHISQHTELSVNVSIIVARWKCSWCWVSVSAGNHRRCAHRAWSSVLGGEACGRDVPRAPQRAPCAPCTTPAYSLCQSRHSGYWYPASRPSAGRRHSGWSIQIVTRAAIVSQFSPAHKMSWNWQQTPRLSDNTHLENTYHLSITFIYKNIWKSKILTIRNNVRNNSSIQE